MPVLSVTVGNTQNVPLILGGTTNVVVSIKNISSTIYLYNLNIVINTPDGLTIENTSEPITSSISNPNGSKAYNFINIKDLAPLEVNYTFTMTVRAATTFANGSTIPFGYTFTGFSIACQMDTMPRGNYDIGNQIETGTVTMTYIAARYKCSISTAAKVLKGAGTSIFLNDYSQTSTATCTFINNGVSASGVSAKILLPNGIRYLGNIIATGTSPSQFLNPTVSTVTVNGSIFTQLYFGGLVLPQNSSTNVTFTYAIWNRYDENTGSLINHATSLTFQASMFDSIETAEATRSFLAMDVIITDTIAAAFVDIGDIVNFSFSYLIGGYYDIQSIVIHYLMGDGITYLTSSVTPTSVVDNPTLKGYYLTYNVPIALKNSVATVNLTGEVSSNYRYKFDSQNIPLPVVAYDNLRTTDDIQGTLVGLGAVVTDSASASTNIDIATIQKEFLAAYYSDNTLKTISALAPGDFAEYKLTYNASTLNAIQKEINMYDFFPLAAGPIDGLPYTYTGYQPLGLAPLPIEPHGIIFEYGDISGNELITITYKVPIDAIGNPADNNNLFKYSGINTDGIAYSLRTQVLVNIATPNIQLSKTVSGPNINAIQVGEVYTYTVTISNDSTGVTGTDAFDFVLSDSLSNWFTVNPGSITVSGTGTYNTPVLTSNSIDIDILQLSPGETLTLSYTATISNVLVPNLTITTTATNTNPYSQANDSTSYQYTNQSRSASTTIKSLNITFNKTVSSGVLKIGSYISYTITTIVPLGTIAYNLTVIDTLPLNNQTFISATKNGIAVTPTVSNNIITFPTESVVDSRVTQQTIVYVIYCQIVNGTKSLNTTTLIQTNNYRCNYYRISTGGTVYPINKSLNVTINVPNILLNLTATDTVRGVTYTSTGSIYTNSILKYKLVFTNNSAINLVNGVIELPVPTALNFGGFNSLFGCTASFNAATSKITINVASLAPSEKGNIIFTATPISTTPSSTVIQNRATAIQYYNDIYSKVYGGETSNYITLTFGPGVSLLPDPAYRVNDSTSFRISQPGSTVTILNFFSNTGGGLDSFTTTLAPVALPYALYIDDVLVANVPANTAYSQNLTQMANVPSGASKVIKIVTQLPQSMALGTRYDFVVTTTSLTAPYPSKTVTNIDPR